MVLCLQEFVRVYGLVRGLILYSLAEHCQIENDLGLQHRGALPVESPDTRKDAHRIDPCNTNRFLVSPPSSPTVYRKLIHPKAGPRATFPQSLTPDIYFGSPHTVGGGEGQSHSHSPHFGEGAVHSSCNSGPLYHPSAS